MSLPSLNITQDAQVMEALFKSTASSYAPLLLLESFMTGVLSACIPVGTYLLWAKPNSFARVPIIAVLWFIFTALITHWALSLRYLRSIFLGRSLAISITPETLYLAIEQAEIVKNTTSYPYYPFQPALNNILLVYEGYGTTWQYLVPLLAETTLFGLVSFLFILNAFTSFRKLNFKGRSCLPSIIPIMASVMYALSLAHWAVSLHIFLEQAVLALARPDSFLEDIDHMSITLLALLSFNAIMSDSIVIWRMCAVWDRSRPVIAFGAALLLTILGLNIANIIFSQAVFSQTDILFTRDVVFNGRDPEIIASYGRTSIGLAAAFVSLISNLCATTLVGVKAWLHRRQFPMRARSDGRRTIVERFMTLLVDSGVVYTAIWLLYCISFFRPITSQSVLSGSGSDNWGYVVTTSSYLDASMAQITSIYPLAVFILVTLDRVHHSRQPQILRKNDWPKERVPTVSVTLEVDVERNGELSPPSVHPMAVLSYTDDSTAAVDEEKLSGSKTA